MPKTTQPDISKFQLTRLIRVVLLVIISLLIVQFVVGMYLNLYVTLPTVHPGIVGGYVPSISWSLSGATGAALAIHVANWLLMSFSGLTLLVLSIMVRRKLLIIGTLLGLLSILFAGSSGLTFINRGGANRESLWMALGFILALVAYGVTYYRSRPQLRS